jgi:hypothetical protein
MSTAIVKSFFLEGTMSEGLKELYIDELKDAGRKHGTCAVLGDFNIRVPWLRTGVVCDP